MYPIEVQELIEKGLPGAQAIVKSDDQTHFEAVIICADFAGKTRVKQHQMVYATLGTHLESDIHALSLHTYTPEQYQNQSHG